MTGNNQLPRRSFLKLTAGAVATTILARNASWGADAPVVPSYLKGYEDLYKTDPRAAAIKWFREARFGMFIHYGLYSMLGRHEWEQLRSLTPVAEYAKLKDRFTAEKFSADAFVDLAIAAQMKYITITTRHHDSFSLFNTKQSDFNSVNSAAKRDLIKELSDACQKKGIGLSLYYSHGRDWKHPDAPNNDEWGGQARPKYHPAEPSYHYGKDHDLQRYVAFMKNQITELLTGYGPIVAIWLDGIAVPMSRKNRLDEWHLQELYDYIHSLQPQVLVSYKQGLIGTEDFAAPERKAVPSGNKPMEICDTLQDGAWGYNAKAKHKTPDEVMKMLRTAGEKHANLLLNTGPLGDGSIHSADIATLTEVGNRIRKSGFP